jgi:hypothetical protein
MTFKTMLTAVLRRIPDFVTDPVGAVRYETIGLNNGYRHLPATFTPGMREGPGFAEVIARWQENLDRQPNAYPADSVPDPSGNAE